MPGEHLTGTEGMSEARDAFRDVMEAESPTRSVRRRVRKSEEQEDNRQDISDVFPNRQMNRSEREGGADDEPEVVREARAKAGQGNRDFGQIEEPDDEESEEPIEDAAPPHDPDEDEPEDDEDVEDNAPDDDESSDDEPAVAFDPDQIVRVQVDGKPVEVSLGEALNGYIRQETFHQRMNGVGDAVKALNAKQTEFASLQQQHIEWAETVEQIFNEFMPAEPNWAELYQQPNVNAPLLKHQWDEIQKKVQTIVEGRKRAQAQREAEEAQRLHAYVAASRQKLAAAHPEWRDEKVWKRDMDSMQRTARDEGYSEDEIRQLYDARAMNILLDASRYRRMMRKKPKPVRAAATPTRKHTATPPRNAMRSLDRAEKRLSRTGSLKDAERVFQGMLDREG